MIQVINLFFRVEISLEILNAKNARKIPAFELEVRAPQVSIIASSKIIY